MKKNPEAEQAACKRHKRFITATLVAGKNTRLIFLHYSTPSCTPQSITVHLVTVTVKMLTYGLYPVLPSSFTENTEK